MKARCRTLFGVRLEKEGGMKYRIELHEGNGVWTPVDNGLFDSLEEAQEMLPELYQLDADWEATELRIVEVEG